MYRDSNCRTILIINVAHIATANTVGGKILLSRLCIHVSRQTISPVTVLTSSLVRRSILGVKISNINSDNRSLQPIILINRFLINLRSLSDTTGPSSNSDISGNLPPVFAQTQGALGSIGDPLDFGGATDEIQTEDSHDTFRFP